MRRSLAAPAWRAALLAIPMFLAPASAPAQATAPARADAPEAMAQTARYIAGFQNDDGGFGPGAGQPSTLGATSSALRTLKYVAGSVPNLKGCRAFVERCIDPATGGFAPTPGGAPDVTTTAIGLMAIHELGLDTPERVQRASKFLAEKAKSFEEVRMAAAGLEAVKAGVPEAVADTWVEIVTAGRHEDGTWGTAATRAFDTGGRAAALLRMGKPLDHEDAIADAILAGQRPDGGWSKDGTTSDLGSTYRIMRAAYMMKLRPNLDAVKAFLAAHRQADGGSGGAPGKPSDPGSTYTAAIVTRWARLLGGEPAVVETAGFRPLLTNSTLDGWDGAKQHWKVVDGVLTGETTGLDHNEFLVAPGTYRDFVLKFSFRLRGGQGNSGVQFRSERIPGTEMKGYQADIGENYWGSLYDESRRNRILAQASEKALEAVRPGDWNHYEIRAQGNHIRLTLNGVTSVDYREAESDIADSGKIAVQIHAGGPMKVEFKDLYLQPLATPEPCPDPRPGFQLRTLKVGDQERPYSVFLPTDYDGQRSYPVVLFLHGSGERGTDGKTQAQTGLGAIIAGRPDDFPVIAVFPQAQKTWAADSDDAKAALAALDDVLKTFKGDPDRVILTGLSMGGHGTWQLAEQDPKRWAAIVPVCGFSGPTAAAPIAAAKLPVWSLIGDADSARLLGSTRAMVEALRAAGAEPRETEYRDVGHNSWDRAYSDPKLLDWMLQQRRKGDR